MNVKKLGILHPGEMGISVAASALNNGNQVYWTSEGRSNKTRERAEKYGLIETLSVAQLCQTCEIILSICPPHAALAVARSVVAAEFKGVFLEANAIAPQHSINIGKLMEDAGIQFVDGGIIGGPAWTPKETCLYLSGKHSWEVASCFSKGPLEIKVIGNEIGRASALKMCYAAYSKGTTALLTSILATAQSLGVREELCQQWDLDEPGFPEQVNRRVMRATAKSWRFEGEMEEIATTFEEAGLPNGFHKASAEIYHRMAGGKGSEPFRTVEEVLTAILGITR